MGSRDLGILCLGFRIQIVRLRDLGSGDLGFRV